MTRRLTSIRSKITTHNDFSMSVIALQKHEQNKVNTFDPASLNEVDYQTSYHYYLQYFEQGNESAIFDSSV